MVADVLLRRLCKLIPTSVVEAFPDDTVMVVENSRALADANIVTYRIDTCYIYVTCLHKRYATCMCEGTYTRGRIARWRVFKPTEGMLTR